MPRSEIPPPPPETEPELPISVGDAERAVDEAFRTLELAVLRARATASALARALDTMGAQR
jgi:hypothetical protein